MQQVLDKIVKNLPQELQSMIKKENNQYIITVYGMMQIFLKVHNKNLLIVSGNNLAPQVFQQSSQKLISTLPDNWVQKGVQENQFFI